MGETDKPEMNRENLDSQDRSADPQDKSFIAPPKDIPKDFADRIAAEIIAINERGLDEETISIKVSALLYRNMNHPDLFPCFNETIYILLREGHTRKYAATAWTSLFWHEDVHPEYRTFVKSLIVRIIHGHLEADLPNYHHEESGKTFSAYAYTLGEMFIQMMRLNSDLYSILTEIFVS
ncbi:MAG: hypothetical protein GY866_18995, partial [Proteobacteria bacterium]|nr:hypothetical protein [Pseudomonadota bacterium]